MFEKNKEYKRSEIHDKYKGNRQKGISHPSDGNFIMLFTSERGKEYGYIDDWTSEGVFLYSGEGAIGDMSFTAGNKELRDANKNRKDIFLFKQTRKGYVRFLDQVDCIGYYTTTGIDSKEQQREMIIFELIPISDVLLDFEDELLINQYNDEEIAKLEKIAEEDYNDLSPKERKVLYYHRSIRTKTIALSRANGFCEGCSNKAPFLTMKNEPYLEVHHIHKLSDGGPDTPDWVAALCPNCHRKAHFSYNYNDFNIKLRKKVLKKNEI